MRREYYLHKRKNGIFYVEFVNSENGIKLSARSTGETELLKAQIKAELWKVNGIPTGKQKKPRPLIEAAGIETIIKAIRKSELNSDDALRIVATLKSIGLIDIAAVKNTGLGAVPFVQFLETFWDYERSEYIKDKLSHGHRFSRGYARECQIKVKSEIKPFFGDKKSNLITVDDLKRLSNQLADRGLATSTINQIMLVCQTPLKWAYKQGIIPVDPTLGLTRFSVINRERGILTLDEIKTVIFADCWKDKRAQVASMVSVSTGIRQGEVLALRLSDIAGDFINIAHSYSPVDGLKCTKTGKKRDVFLQPFVREALMDLLQDNPHESDDPFFFYSLSPDKPCDCKILLDGLKKVMEKVGIDWKTRNITFHSWRHWFVTTANKDADAKKVMKASGHLTDNVFQRYAAHVDDDDIREVGAVIAKTFEKIIPFNKAG